MVATAVATVPCVVAGTPGSQIIVDRGSGIPPMVLGGSGVTISTDEATYARIDASWAHDRLVDVGGSLEMYLRASREGPLLEGVFEYSNASFRCQWRGRFQARQDLSGADLDFAVATVLESCGDDLPTPVTMTFQRLPLQEDPGVFDRARGLNLVRFPELREWKAEFERSMGRDLAADTGGHGGGRSRKERTDVFPSYWRGIVPPEPVQKTQPDYPESAREAGIGARLIVEAVVGADGTVVANELRKCSTFRTGEGPGDGDEKYCGAFYASATAAINRWTYRPAMLDSKPVAVYTTVVVEFLAP
jgi:hypothetical protein